jgi:ABC-2 type transport system ATP-binding protein
MLEIHKLNKVYGNHRALSDVDLFVPKGVIFGLLGPNGAGKTTLIRIINQIIQQDSGEILLENQLLSPQQNQKIGYLPEERGLYKKMSVWDQLIYFARLKGLGSIESKQKVKNWLDKLEISDWRNKKIEDLSKGMAQKVQFISTVIHEPSLLILDEPFSGFDPVNAEIIKNEILELKTKGITVILSTHRLESVELLCDYVALLHKSKKILDGKVTEVKRNFKTDRFFVSLSELKKDVPQDWSPVNKKDEKSGFSLSLNGKTPNQLLTEVMSFGEVFEFREQVPSMEEIFIQQVKSNTHE